MKRVARAINRVAMATVLNKESNLLSKGGVTT